jgi:drug/metabolite transporter (DMT)-like permease
VNSPATTFDSDAALHRPRRYSVLAASLMALTAGMVWSFGGLTARLAKQTDAWQYLVWRSVGVFVVMELLNLRKRRAPLVGTAFGTGKRMLFACAALMLASVCFVYAIKNTSAANAALLSSITPLLAAVLARVFIGEHLSRVTIAAIGVAFIGLFVMVTGSGAGGGNNSMAGNIAAMVSALGFAGYMVTIRSSADRDWGPVLPGYAIMTVLMCGAVTVINGNPLFPSAHDVGLAVLHGGAFIVIGTLLFNAGSRHVPAAAMAVFSQTETVFVPIWVFLGLGERPAGTTILGGLIIMTAVVGKALLERR